MVVRLLVSCESSASLLAQDCNIAREHSAGCFFSSRGAAQLFSVVPAVDY